MCMYIIKITIVIVIMNNKINLSEIVVLYFHFHKGKNMAQTTKEIPFVKLWMNDGEMILKVSDSDSDLTDGKNT